MPNFRREEIDYVDRRLREMLIDRLEPGNGTGLSSQRMVEDIAPTIASMRAEPELSNVVYRSLSKLIERRIGFAREQAYEEIRQQVGDRSQPGVGNALQFPIRCPDFLPFALAQGERLWLYFNAIRPEYLRRIIQIQNQREEGFENAATLLSQINTFDEA